MSLLHFKLSHSSVCCSFLFSISASHTKAIICSHFHISCSISSSSSPSHLLFHVRSLSLSLSASKWLFISTSIHNSFVAFFSIYKPFCDDSIGKNFFSFSEKNMNYFLKLSSYLSISVYGSLAFLCLSSESVCQCWSWDAVRGGQGRLPPSITLYRQQREPAQPCIWLSDRPLFSLLSPLLSASAPNSSRSNTQWPRPRSRSSKTR